MGRRSRTRTSDLDLEGLGAQSRAAAGFPLVVAALSTIAALLLFFTGTVPAMQETRHLRDVETDRARVHGALWNELDAEVANRWARKIDIQSLLVELDRRGVDARPILFPSPGPGQKSNTACADPVRESGEPHRRDRR